MYIINVNHLRLKNMYNLRKKKVNKNKIFNLQNNKYNNVYNASISLYNIINKYNLTVK